MLLVSEALTPDDQPMILAFGAERIGGKIHCEIVYVSPTPGVDTKHTPLAEGPETFYFRAEPGAEPTTIRIRWPGLTTDVPVDARLHNNIILSITKEEKHNAHEKEKQPGGS